MEKNDLIATGIIGFLIAAVLCVSVDACGKYSAKQLDARKACIQAGHNAVECGFVHQVPN